MSNKANARKYSVATSPSEGGILPGIGALFGADKMTGGLKQNPDGTWSYTAPAVAHPVADKWLMGGAGAREASNLRNTIEPTLYLAQEAMKKQAELERIRAQLTAMQSRAQYGRDVEMEGMKHGNRKSEIMLGDSSRVMANAGLMPINEGAIQSFAASNNPIAAKNAMAQAYRQNVLLNDTELQDAQRQDMLDKYRASGLANINAATIKVGPNDTAFAFDPKAPRDPNTMMQLGGVRQLGQTQTTKLDEFGKPISTTSTVQTAPGQIQRYPVAQSLIEQAGKLAPGGVNVDLDGTDNSRDANDILEFFRRYITE